MGKRSTSSLSSKDNPKAKAVANGNAIDSAVIEDNDERLSVGFWVLTLLLASGVGLGGYALFYKLHELGKHYSERRKKIMIRLIIKDHD